MSSRQLRKLQKQKEAGLAPEGFPEGSEGSDEPDEPSAPAKPRASLFAALGGEGEDGDEDDDQEGAEAGQEPVGTEQQMSESRPPASANKSKKKKKKKKKAKAAPAAAEDPAGDDGDNDQDEIDRAIKELKITTRNDAPSAGSGAKSSAQANEVLKINPYHLKAINEMRNLFGRDIIESAETEEEQEQHRQRRNRPQQVDLETFLREPPWAKKLPEVSLRRNVFVQGREHWPRQSACGLTMGEVDKATDGSWTEYAYSHNQEYDRVQSIFFACVQIGDPMAMVHMLKEFPYHVSTLLQVSSVAKQDQNMALASELCERALFTFGRVATSAFRQNLEQGRARLNFRRPENRQFWLAGYHYLKSLVRKGTYRTALEWAKLLYTLNPEDDPYAMRHYIHFLAVRAYESRWLLDFLDEREVLEKTDHSDTIYLRQSAILAKLQMGDVEEARQDLVKGMQRAPWLYCALFQELGLDAPPSIWGISADSNARWFWIRLYLYQTKDLWNNTQATALLKDVATSLPRVDKAALPYEDAPPDLGATRLAFLEGQTSLLAVAPRHLLDSHPNYEFDPLPPPEEDNIFTSEGVRLPWEDSQSQTQARTRADEIVARMHNLMPQRAAAAGAPGAAAVAGAPGGFGGDEEGDDQDMPTWSDDEELQRDLEADASRANAPGLIATLMQMLGGNRGEQADEGGASGPDDEAEEEAEGPPGAWPEEGDGDDRRR